MEVRGARSSWLTMPRNLGARARILGRLTWRCPVRIRRLVPILGLAASLVSPASAQNPGALHWRQKTGLGVMLAGVVAIGIAHERHAPDPLRRRRPIGGGLVVAGAVLPVPEPVRPDVAVGPAGWAVGKTWSWGAGGRDPRHDGAAGAGGDLDKSTTWSTVDLPAPDDEFGGSEARRVRRCRGPARPARRSSRRARGSWISLPLTLPPLQSRTSADPGPAPVDQARRGRVGRRSTSRAARRGEGSSPPPASRLPVAAPRAPPPPGRDRNRRQVRRPVERRCPLGVGAKPHAGGAWEC